MSDADMRMPRRMFIAAGLSALTAGAVVGLGVLGAVTTPQTETFQFSRGTAFVTGDEQRLRGFLAKAARDNRVSVVITGHTGSQGDAGANLELSQARADVAAGLAREMGVEPTRIIAAGAGGGAPFAQPSDLSDRAYQTALARVTVTLQVRQ